MRNSAQAEASGAKAESAALSTRVQEQTAKLDGLTKDLAAKDEAIAYCERKGLEYRVVEPKEKTAKTLSYSENFKYGRIGTWTH